MTLAGSIQSWLAAVGRTTWDRGNPAPAWEFLFQLEDADCPPVDYTLTEPPWLTLPGPGLTVRRSGWDAGATYFGLWSGPLRESHQDQDCNGLGVWKNGWLLAPSHVWSASGIVHTTLTQNNWTFGNATYQQESQPPTAQWPGEAGTLLAAEHTPTYSYVAGQAANAYVHDRSHGGIRLVTDYLRRLVYLPSVDSFVLLDRIDAAPLLPREFHLQARGPFTGLSGPSYRTQNAGGVTLYGTMFGAAPSSVVDTPVNNGAGGTLSNYRLDVTYPAQQGANWYGHVWQLLPTGATPQPVSAVFLGGAAYVAVGSALVVLPLADSPLTLPLRINTMASEVKVAGLTPGVVNYRLDGGPLQAALVSSAGVLDLSGLPTYTLLEIAPNLAPSINADPPIRWAPLLGLDPAFAASLPGAPWPDVATMLSAAKAGLDANASKVTA